MRNYICLALLLFSVFHAKAWNAPSISSPAAGADVWVGVTLNWNAVNGSQAYQFQLDTTAGFNSPVLLNATNNYINSSSGNSDTQSSPSGLFFGKTYYWRVRAYVSGDTSVWTSSTFITRDYVTTTSPAEGSSVWTGFTLNWAPHAGVSFYDVQVDTALSFNTPAFRTVTNTYVNSTDGNNDTQWFINNLFFGKTYYWRVRARNSADTSSWSGPLTFITRDFVNNTGPEEGSSVWTGLTLNWAPHAGVSFYDVQVDTSQSFNSPAFRTVTNTYVNSTDGNNDTQWFIDNLYFGKTYFWRLRARNSIDSSSWSGPFTFVTRDFVNKTGPDNSTTWTGLTINWAPHSGVDFYDMQIDTSAAFDSGELNTYTTNYINSTDGNSDTQFFVQDLLFGLRYYWRVRARNAVDTSLWGDPFLFDTRNFVNLTSPNDGNQNTSLNPSLNWAPHAGIVKYQQQIDTSNLFNTGAFSEVFKNYINSTDGNSDTQQAYSGLNPNTIYYWRVRAINNRDTSAWTGRWFNTGTGSPSFPQTPNVTSAFCSSIATSINPTLAWDEVNNADYYEIEIQPSTIPLSGNATNSNINTNSFQTSSLQSNISYCWSVRAVINNIAGNWSSPCCFSIPGEPEISQAIVSQTEICEGDELNINASITGTFTSGNTFSVELSDAAGNFDSPSVLFTFTNLQPSYTVYLPPAITGSGFRIRIVSSDPFIEGSASAPFQIAALPILEGDLNTLTCVQLNSIELPLILPEGGSYSGAFVTDNLFSPANAGIGSTEVFYTYISSNGCSATSSGLVQVDACTQLSSNPIAQIQLINRALNISLNSNVNAEIKLIDLTGRIVLRSELQGKQTELLLHDIPAGIYLYVIHGEGIRSSGKIAFY